MSIENKVEPEMKFRQKPNGQILTVWKRSQSDPQYWITVELPVYCEFKFSDSSIYVQVTEELADGET